ncbi:Highly reducing polyketide synthase easB [Cladobotryum mycophilum]|uniref:Highly reducing polyketide synthase easB n=1 Tax=Cladobotryum mycophilum TaxID=491253 RepID=A0ABR0SC67_9HYPO
MRPEDLQRDVPEPIAIIGMSCRFSGMASNQHGFWQLLSKGMTTWSNNAKDRFRMKSFWHPEALLPGSTNCQGMHLLTEDPALFDNDFFQISSLEAKAIDPQQRLILEVVYEAFENAGVPLEKVEKSNTGVYCASNHPEYDQILGRDPEVSPTYRFTGTGANLMANRISYVFDLRGPSFVVDTACSSSFVALHDAVNALRSGEIDQAIVGGCNILLDPDMFAIQSSMTFLSPHGRCYSFDSRANGYGRGDGAVALLLKPLRAAIRDGDAVRGVIRGTALGSDGKTFGITMPSSDAQYETISRAYASAGLDPGETAFVEAHGTGTTAGDGAEVAAFTKAFCTRRPAFKKLYVGSVKSNIGHTEHTSGIAGLVKALLMLENGLLVPNPTFKTPNPALELDKAGIEVVTKVAAWPEGEPRRISINSSGYGGTNAHVIIEAGNAWHKPPIKLLQSNGTSTETQAEPKIFCFTHQRQQAIYKMATTWRRFLSSPQELSLDSLAYTLGSRRSMHPHRAVVVASNLNTLIEGLRLLEKGLQRPAKAYNKPKIWFVFTGQGAQWAQMGRELLSFYPLFRQAIQRAEEDLLGFGATWKLIEELEKPAGVSRVNEAELAQPCTTAIQIALVDLLESFGVRPCRLCGHSSGEIPAAYALGALSASDAMKIAYFRGMAVNHLKQIAPQLGGAMLAVGLSEAAARQYLEAYESGVTLACINSSNSVTLSGNSSAIDELALTFEAAKIFNRKLAVGVAYHSPHMKIVEDFYYENIKDIQPKPSKDGVQMASSVTGKLIQGEELDPKYWVQNLVSPVRFSDGLSKALQLAGTEASLGTEGLIVEIGPQPALRGPINQILKDCMASDIHYLASLNQKQEAVTAILMLLGELFSRGVNVLLNQVNKISDCQNVQVLTNLPSYNWHHEVRHWNESRRSQHYRFKKFPRHDLLGTLAPDSISTQPSWHNYMRLSETPWLADYCVDGSNVFSGAGYIAMVVEALRQQFAIDNRSWKKKTITMKNIAFTTPLLINADPIGVEIFLQMTPSSSSASELGAHWQEFRIFSVSAENRSTEHCRGIVAVPDSVLQELPENLEQGTSGQPWTRLDPSIVYKELSRIGIQYTGSYVCMEAIAAQPWETKVELSVSDVKPSIPSGHQQAHSIHPTTIESFFQAVFPGLKLAGCLDEIAIPASVDELQLPTDCNLRPGVKLFVGTKSAEYGLARYTSDIWVSLAKTGSGGALFMAKGVKFAVLSGGLPQIPKRPLCYQTKWQLDPYSSFSDSIVTHCGKNLGQTHQKVRNCATAFCRRWIKEALDILTPEEEAAASGFRKYYLEWMLAQDINDSQPISPELENEVMALGAYGEAVVRLGPCLKGIVTGEVDGLSLLMQEDLLYRIYIEREGIARCHTQLANYIRLAKFKAPNLRVLEIGGGTGSLTFPLLEALYGESDSYDRATEKYVFTDVSKGFLALMRERLGKFEPFVELKTLDIEQSASDQSFELGSFDTIVASNVVHATKNLKATLANLKSLLKPGGQLGMVEFTVPTVHGGMVWGVLAGWWFGVEEGRTPGPLLEPPAWDKVLKESGFSGVDLQMKDYDHEEHELSLLLSSAMIEPTAPPEKEVVSIIAADDNTTLANKLASSIGSYFPDTAISVISMFMAEEVGGTIIMLPEISQNALMQPSENNWNRIRDIISNAEKVLWVSTGAVFAYPSPQRTLTRGLGLNLRVENHSLKFYTLDVDLNSNSDSQVVSCILQMYTKIIGPQALPISEWEWEVTARAGELLIPRLVPQISASNWVTDSVSKYHPQVEDHVDQSRSLQLSIRSAGLWDTLYWKDYPNGNVSSLHPTGISIRVDFAALNFRDIMSAMGQIRGSSNLLIEGAGTVIAVGEESLLGFSVGDAVCFLEPNGLGTITNVNHNLVFRIPQGMSMETAAAIPVAYGVALYGLKKVANLQPGETVLIHLGSGAVGQAAIAISRYLGAKEIFVTVGSDEKRELIKRQFAIPDEHIFSSRDLSFGDGILKATHGSGVDVVLNSLSGEAAVVSCHVLAPFGRFIKIGNDMKDNARLQMQLLRENKTISVVDSALIAKSKPQVLRELMQTALDLIQDGKLQMISPITVGHVGSMVEQLECMQAGKHVGKLVLKVDGTQPLKVQPKQPTLPTLDPGGSYLVVGGTEGLGREVVRHLAKLGAKRIITLSLSGADAPKAKELTEEMQMSGVDLVIVKGDVCDQNIVELLKERNAEMSIRGIIQAGIDLKYSLAKGMSHSQWYRSISANVTGTLNLVDNFIAPEALDFFIVLGSEVAIAGGQGAESYSASNTFLDILARHYSSKGQPFRAIDVGYIADLGFTTENETCLSNPSMQNREPISIEEVLAALNYTIANPLASTPDEAQITIGIYRAHQTSGTREAAAQRPDPRFVHLWSHQSQDEQTVANKKPKGGGFDVQAAMKEAKTPKEAVEAAFLGLRAKVILLLSIQAEDFQADRSVISYGMDSLLELQLRNWITGHLGAPVSRVELMSFMSIMELANITARRSRLVTADVFSSSDGQEA